LRRLLVLLALAALAQAGAAVASPPPTPDARAWLVENATTGQVLDAHDVHTRMPIASLTKLMTVLIALQHLKLTDVVQVDPRAADVGQESIELDPGQSITVADLLRGALIQSANDAADALALSVAASFPAFADLMNAKAKQLGLNDTHFVRPDGLDAPGEYSSAHDITLLAQDAMKNAFVRQTVGEQSAVLADGETVHTWDDLLGVLPGILGVKTGHTDEAGWCQVSAQDDDGNVMYVTILGSPDEAQRDADLTRLLTWASTQYRVVDAVSMDRDYASVQLPYGRGSLALVAAQPLQAFVRTGQSLVQRVVAPLSASLPVKQGAVLGQVEVFSGRRLLGRRDLVAARSVAKPGLITRAGWYARRSVHNALGLFS
jgi:serine-type D-Ala-D-Ala carboxypeptidase (penicillin-binding protein 5/6)